MNENVRSQEYPNFKDVILFFGAFFLINLLVGGIVLILSKIGVSEFLSDGVAVGDVPMAVSYTLSFVLMIFLTLIYRRGRLRGAFVSEKYKRGTRFSLYHLSWGIILMLAINVVLEPFVNLFPESVVKMYDSMSSMGNIMILTSVFIAPIVEEILFRAILQNDFQNKYSVTMSVIYTSLIFGIVHLNFIQGVSAFFTSLVLGFIYCQTRSLWAVIFLHFFNNATAQVLFKLYPNVETYTRSIRDIIGIDTVYWSIYGASCTVLVFAIYMIASISKQQVEKITVDQCSDNESSIINDINEVTNNNSIDVDVKFEDNKI